MQPEFGSLVMGGHAPGPQPGSLVLGGHSQKLGKLFDRFNAEAKILNRDYRYLRISENLGLTRTRKADPYADIKVKYLYQPGENDLHPYWDFAGYLKHDGLLFGANAQYVTAGCLKHIRPTVLKELLGAKL